MREYLAKKEWFETEVKRAIQMTQGNPDARLKELLERVEQLQREWFGKFEDILHRAQTGPMWLKHESAAEKVAEGLRRLGGEMYRLDAYCVMSNHVHTIFTPLVTENELRETFDHDGHLIFLSEHPGLSRIMQALKGRSARECNASLSRSGQFWEHESFDHVIRPGRLAATIKYVLNNPVKAGLVENWREWRWSYCRSELIDQQ